MGVAWRPRSEQKFPQIQGPADWSQAPRRWWNAVCWVPPSPSLWRASRRRRRVFRSGRSSGESRSSRQRRRWPSLARRRRGRGGALRRARAARCHRRRLASRNAARSGPAVFSRAAAKSVSAVESCLVIAGKSWRNGGTNRGTLRHGSGWKRRLQSRGRNRRLET